MVIDEEKDIYFYASKCTENQFSLLPEPIKNMPFPHKNYYPLKDVLEVYHQIYKIFKSVPIWAVDEHDNFYRV